MFKVISEYTVFKGGKNRKIVDIRCEDCGKVERGIIGFNFKPNKRCWRCQPKKSKSELAEEAREYNLAYQAKLRAKRATEKVTDTIETTFVHREYTPAELEMIASFKPKKLVGTKTLMKPVETIRFTDKGKPDVLVTTLKPVMTVVVHEYDFREISEALDISYEEAKRAYNDAINKLRRLLDREALDTINELYG